MLVKVAQTLYAITIVTWRCSYVVKLRKHGTNIITALQCGKETWQLYKRIKLVHARPHWGRVTHVCISKSIIIIWNNGLSSGRCQAIIWTKAGLLFIRTSGTNYSEIWNEIHTFSFKRMHLNTSSAWWQQFVFLALLVLNHHNPMLNALGPMQNRYNYIDTLFR